MTEVESVYLFRNDQGYTRVSVRDTKDVRYGCPVAKNVRKATILKNNA